MASDASVQDPKDISGHGIARNVRNTCGFFLDAVRPDFKVLDAGCGPGTVTSSFATLLPQGHIIGVDISDQMINKARAQEDLATNCSFETADITSTLPFPDDTFDVVYTSQTLTHIPKALDAMKELRRVCKPGGFLACREGDLGAIMIYPQHPGLDLWAQAAVAALDHKKCHARAGIMLRHWALEAGFTEDNITSGLGALMYSGRERESWGQAMIGRTKDESWRQNARDCGVVYSDEDFVSMQEGWTIFMQEPGAMFAIPCGEIVCYI